MKKKKQHPILGLIIIIAIIGVVYACIPGEENPDPSLTSIQSSIPADTNKGVEEEIQLPEYQIIEVGDVSFGNIKRYSLSVITEPTDEQTIKLIATTIIENLKIQKPFNSVYIYFNDQIEYIGQGYSLARALYAPNGKWEEAMNVRTGDYNTMKFAYDIKEKKIEKRPTAEEVKLYKYWNEVYDEMDTNLEEFPNEDIVSQMVAEHFNINPDEVNLKYMKVLLWIN